MKKRIISIFLMFLLIFMQCVNNTAYASIIFDSQAYGIVDSNTIAKDKEVNVVYRYYINGKAKDFDESVPISFSYAVSDKFDFKLSNLPNAAFKNQLLTASGLSKETGKYIEYNIVLKAKENIDIKNLSDLGKITVTYKNNQGNGNLKTEEAAVKIVLKDSNSSSYKDTTNLQFTAQNNKTEIFSDEKFETSFTIEPQGQVSIERKPVSIILVMDTSGSMKENSKIDKSKEAAKKLMDTIYNNRIGNDKVGLVDFDTYVNNNSGSRDVYYTYGSYWDYWGTWETKYNTSICSSLKYVDDSTLNDYKNKINKMYAISSDVVGGTNLESALLLSKGYFNNDSNEKHIIVLTDGNPTFYMQSDGSIKGHGSGYDETAADKAINVLNDLKSMGVKTHFIGLKTNDNDINDNFLNAAASAGGGLKFTTKNPDEVDSIMQNIYSVINKSIVYSNINFEYVLPEGIEVDKASLPNGFKVENGKVTGQINDIEFKNNQSPPQPYNFKISFKAKKTGDIDLGEAQINYTKNSMLGNTEGIRKAELGSIKVNIRDFGVDLDFNANKSSENLYLDQELTLNYSINPKGILNLTRKPVSIVLIMDSSGSMAQLKIFGDQIIKKTDNRYVNTKMYYASESAKKLMDSIYSKSMAGDKIGLVDFDTYVNDNNSNPLIDSNNLQNINLLKNKINNMYAEGGTNLEAGLLKAKEYFSSDNTGNDKYIILLTDGMPSLYFDSNGKLAGIGSSYDNTAGEEANNAAKELSRMGVKLNVIGVDTENGDVKKEYIDNLAAISGGVSYYTSNPQSIDSLMQETYKIINKSVVYENITITQDIPSGLTPCSLPNGWKIENGRLTGYVENIVFENKSNKTPEAKVFTVKLKASTIGEYDLGNVTMNYSMKFDEFSTAKEPKNISLGKVSFKLKDFSNYINFNDMQINKKIVPNKTTFSITITRNKNELYNLSNDAKVELILGTDNNKVSILSKTGTLLFDKNSTSKTCSYQASIIGSSKEQSSNITVKAIKITFNGQSYTIDSKDEIAKYFNDKEPVQKLKVKKFSLR